MLISFGLRSTYAHAVFPMHAASMAWHAPLAPRVLHLSAFHCFINPYCCCVLSDDQYPIHSIEVYHIINNKAYLCNCTCNVHMTKMVLEYSVPGTGLCTIMVTVQARTSHTCARAASYACLRQRLLYNTLRTIVFGGLHHVFCRLGYTINTKI